LGKGAILSICLGGSFELSWFLMNARGELSGVIATLAGCACVLYGVIPASAATGATEKATMQVTSTAFSEGQPIPEKYTCQGKDISPPLKWSGAPASAKSLVLIADDPDAPVGVWVHWVLYDIPATVGAFAEDLPKSQFTPEGAKQGLNDFKHLGYGGPCPPPGKAHRYFFKLYALDSLLNLKAGSTKQEVERVMEKHVLAEGRLMGTYQRK
jgi:Raf kinase inhibitor-like YbhB/YbcL family protein